MLKNIYFAFCIVLTGSVARIVASDKPTTLSNIRLHPIQWLNKTSIEIIKSYLPGLAIVEGSKREYALSSDGKDKKGKETYQTSIITEHDDASRDGIRIIQIYADPSSTRRSTQLQHWLIDPFGDLASETSRWTVLNEENHALSMRQIAEDDWVAQHLQGTIEPGSKAALTHNDSMLVVASKNRAQFYKTELCDVDLGSIIGDKALKARAKKRKLEACRKKSSFDSNPITAFYKGDQTKINNFYWALANRMRPAGFPAAR